MLISFMNDAWEKLSIERCCCVLVGIIENWTDKLFASIIQWFNRTPLEQKHPIIIISYRTDTKTVIHINWLPNILTCSSAFVCDTSYPSRTSVSSAREDCTPTTRSPRMLSPRRRSPPAWWSDMCCAGAAAMATMAAALRTDPCCWTKVVCPRRSLGCSAWCARPTIWRGSSRFGDWVSHSLIGACVWWTNMPIQICLKNQTSRYILKHRVWL